MLDAFRAELRDSMVVPLEDLMRAWAATGLRASDFSAAKAVAAEDDLIQEIHLNDACLLELSRLGLDELHRRGPLSADTLAEYVLDRFALTRLRHRHHAAVGGHASAAARTAHAAGADRRLSHLRAAIRIAACRILITRLAAVDDSAGAAFFMDDWKASGLRERDFMAALGGLEREGFLGIHAGRDWPTIVLKRPLPRHFRIYDRLVLLALSHRERLGRAPAERRWQPGDSGSAR